MPTKFITSSTSTVATATRDSVYFEEPKTSEATKPNAPTVNPTTIIRSATTATGADETVAPYRQSGHKIVTKRYAVTRG